MKRITQRCLLVLAFTGVLMVSSQETTVSGVSDSTATSNEQTSPSAPESISYSVEKSSSYSPTDTTEDHSFSTSAVSSSKQETTSVTSTTISDITDSESASSKDGMTESTVESVEDESENDRKVTHDNIVQSTDFVSTTEETLVKAELQEAERKDNLIHNKTTEKIDKDLDSSTNSAHAQDISTESSESVASSGVKEVSSAATLVSELKETSETTTPSENIASDNGQSSVPSVEETVYSTSYVDHITDKMFSTTPSKVQTVESNTSDLPKSATRKRSLNATNAGNTNVSSVSTVHVTTPLSSDISTKVTEVMHTENLNNNSGVLLGTELRDVHLSSTLLPNADFVSSKSVNPSQFEKSGSTGSPYIVNGVIQNVSGNAAQNGENEYAPKAAANSLNMISSPASSIALSTDNGESIHSLGNVDHLSHLEMSSRPPLNLILHEKLVENEDGFSFGSSNSPRKVSSVTFDPNGMTHKYSQDPDSITFTPETIYIDGMPTNGYLSRLEEIKLTSNKPIIDLQYGMPAESSTNGALGNSFSEVEINTPEREREYMSPSGISLLPHDEPDLEEMSDKYTLQDSKKQTDSQFPKDSSLQSQTSIPVQTNKPPVHAPNDESEEMLNDSPNFDQNKFNHASSTEIKIEEITHALNKALETNVINDIKPSTGSNSQNIPKTSNELELSIDYQTAQSEIRPVTVLSPFQTSDSPIPTTFEASLSPEFTKSDRPDTTLPNTSSPIVQPNPAPSIDNLKVKATTIEIPPHLLPPGYAHKPETEAVNETSKNSSTDVTSQTPKLTAIEIPPHLLPPGYVPEPETKSVTSKDSSVATANLTPKGTATELPSHLLPPGYKPEPKTENKKENFKDSPSSRPKITVVELPSHLLPPGYTPEPEVESSSEASKILSGSIFNLRPKVKPTELPPNLLPPGYKPEPEPENKSEASKDSSSIGPKVTAIEIPSHLLPPGYTPQPEPENKSEASKDSSSSKPKITPIELPSNLLPPGYVPESEPENGNGTSKNSTIAGVAVKTSVSVSLPLSKSTNNSTSSKEADGGKSSDASAPSETTTEASGFKIRKPKIRIGVTEESATPRTRKPFISALQRPSTTVGPPVSIFKKSRTRANSITSSTTARPLGQYSTIRIHYASRMPGMVPNGELVFSFEPVTMTTTVPTTTETEEPFSDEPFNEPTQTPSVSSDDDVTLIRVAGYIVVDKGLRWIDQLSNRHSPQYKERANFVHLQLERLFRSSPIAPHLWKIQIDGFSGIRSTRSVAVDFFLYLIKSKKEIPASQLVSVFHDKLKNNTFSRFTVDPSKTTFEVMNEEPLRTTTPAPEEERESVLPQWAIAVIVVGAASLIFIILFAAVAILGRHHVRRRYGNKLNDEDSDRPSDWESKMAAAYENLAADTIYDVEDMHGDTPYKKNYNSTFHGRPSKTRRADSWSSYDWSPPPRRPRPQVHKIVY